ncbi:hypothetical protein ABPG72_007895, partial [Tetrahymena utriculariae]
IQCSKFCRNLEGKAQKISFQNQRYQLKKKKFFQYFKKAKFWIKRKARKFKRKLVCVFDIAKKMIQYIKRNIFFFVTLLTSSISFSLLWVFFGFGISFGTLFIYQGLLMILPISEVTVERRLKFSFLLTGLLIGPITTLIYTFICLDYIFQQPFEEFQLIMGFGGNQTLISIAFIEYSISIAVNVLYLVLLFIASKRNLQSSNHSSIILQIDNNILYRSNLQGSNQDSRNNQIDLQPIQEQSSNGSNVNSSNHFANNNNYNNSQNNRGFVRNVIVINNADFQNIINENQNDNGHRVYSIFYDRQYQQDQQDRNLSSLIEEEEEDSFYLNGQYYFRIIKIDGERQDTIKTTVCSRDAQSQDEGKECAICYEEFNKQISINDKRIISLNCNHTFHATCIRNSVNSIGLKCPYCRQKITQKISQCKQPSNSRYLQDFIAIND